jgi:ferredoxin-type protein NapH
VRHVLCKFVCAAGLMQMLFGWISPLSLRLGMDTARISACTDCKGCDRACFMNVTPRKNKRDISCVNCGACIAACNQELGEGKGLFHLGFGNGPIMPTKQ